MAFSGQRLEQGTSEARETCQWHVSVPACVWRPNRAASEVLTVMPADSRPLSWPPIGAFPRNRLASSATGGASAISSSPAPKKTTAGKPSAGSVPCTAQTGSAVIFCSAIKAAREGGLYFFVSYELRQKSIPDRISSSAFQSCRLPVRPPAR